MLTMPSNGKRLDATLEHFRNQGVEEPAPFHGIDGEAAGLDTRFPYQVDVPGTAFKISPRTIGIHLGHMLLWKVCQYQPVQRFLIFEDDARFVPGWHDAYVKGMAALPGDWDLLYLGSCCCAGRGAKQIDNTPLHRVTYALCLHAYGVRSKALETLWNACQRIYAGVDIAIALHAMDKLKAYAFLPRLFDQDKTEIPP